MTKSTPVHEIGKYFVLVCCIIGVYVKGFSLRSSWYVIYILLFIPSILVAAERIDIDESLRKAIAFNLAGPVVLGVAAVYCYNRKISKQQLLNFFGLGVAGIFAMTGYVIFKAPDLSEITFSSASNALASGGFGPNQVSTAFGIGIFLSFVRFIMIKNLWTNILDLFLFLLFTYRGYLTFSRGGVLTAFLMIGAFIGTIIFLQSRNFRASFIPKFILIGAGILIAFFYSSVVTGGMIENRYTNKDTIGREKEDVSAGRGELANLETQAFLEHPILGLGAGMSKFYKLKKAGIEGASHNEVTRLLAEHGAVGVFSLGLLILVPLFNRLGDRSNMLFYSFLIFWFATINHSAMRNAAPSFLYALALLKIKEPEIVKTDEEEEVNESPNLRNQKVLNPSRIS
ncbi:O-antigen ligase family protein [Nonlabens spongiae]|nr:O-antigen ligase family protein [Nonlabens spongiae]